MNLSPLPLLAAGLALTLCLSGCDRTSPEAEDSDPSASVERPPSARSSLDDGPLPEPAIPSRPGEFSPTMARLAGDFDAHVFGDVNACAGCHAQEYTEWNESSHALSSLNNPFYRFAFEDFFESRPEKVNFCAGCHDLAPMFAGELTTRLEPDNLTGHKGITCVACHGVESTTIDGNASYVLSTAPIPAPTDDDPASLQAHRNATDSPRELGDALCVSCHRAFLSPDTGHSAAIGGINDVTPWLRSAYNDNHTSRIDDPIPAQGCIDCHMPKTGPDGRRSHRFAGGHTTLAAAINSDEQMAAIRALLDNAATIDVARHGQGAFSLDASDELQPNSPLWFDVVVFNQNVGHDFPGGARDLRDTFVAVELLDANSQSLASSGVDHIESGQEPLVHRFRSLLVTPEGESVENHLVHQFRTPVFDQTIAPRDAAVVRYAWQVPDDLTAIALPLKVEARLMHRRFHRALSDNACADLNTERGQGFMAATEEFLGLTVDPCVEQPVLTLDQVTYELDGTSTSPKPAWRRTFEHGLGLRHARQEELPQARQIFEETLRLHQEAASASPESPEAANQRAQILFMLGYVASRQGRTDDAFDYFQEAEDLIGPHPALTYARGESLIRVFRTSQAQELLAKTTSEDDRHMRLLAQASGTNLDAATALRAAVRGLEREPRNPDLLRLQSLAINRLASHADWQEAARQAFLDFKLDEEAPGIRSRCSNNDAECLLERNPVHTHWLR